MQSLQAISVLGSVPMHSTPDAVGPCISSNVTFHDSVLSMSSIHQSLG